MTLCVAWLRQLNNQEELIFATDSCLSGGERWHSGVKLFKLPRKDCLICFAGETNRTYPLILNLISSIKFDPHLANPHTDLKNVLEYLTTLFTELCHSITDYGTQDFKNVLGDFEFLFGGWSWEKSEFCAWKIKYNFDAKAFVHDSIGGENMFFAFIGDETEKAEELLNDELKESGKILVRTFDMEPFKVLLKMLRNNDCSTIGGAIQIAKIYPPGITEFFGVMWPSTDEGKKTFLGRDVTFQNNPAVRFIDPDTCEIVGDELPNQLTSIEKELYGINTEFIQKCYPKGKLKDDLDKKQRDTLKVILQEVAYSQFLKQEEQKVAEDNQEEA
jgi:hypothetical protein